MSYLERNSIVFLVKFEAFSITVPSFIFFPYVRKTDKKETRYTSRQTNKHLGIIDNDFLFFIKVITAVWTRTILAVLVVLRFKME